MSILAIAALLLCWSVEKMRQRQIKHESYIGGAHERIDKLADDVRYMDRTLLLVDRIAAQAKNTADSEKRKADHWRQPFNREARWP